MAEKGSSKTIHLCLHCGSRFVSAVTLCKDCKIKEKRKKMDEENEEIFEASGLQFKCDYCIIERKRQLQNNGQGR